MITITLIVPMYNEEKRIQKCIRALCAYKPPDEVVVDRVVFVDDGSEDSTVLSIKYKVLSIKKRLGCDVQIISYEENRGRGYGLRLGMRQATGDYALWLDADMSTPLSQVEVFLPHFKKGAPVIIGSRKIAGAHVTKRQPLYRILLGQAFSKMSSILLGVPVGDFTCGFKAFSKDAYRSIFPLTRINGWGNDSETLYLSKKFQYEIKELPILWHNDTRTKVKVLRDIVISFSELCRIRTYGMMGFYRARSMQSLFPAKEAV